MDFTTKNRNAFTRLGSFEDELKRAVDVIKADDVLLQNISFIEKKERWKAIAMVIPQVIRWSMFHDIMEPAIDEIVYINFGRADNPMGVFQMRPSFIDTMERYVFTNKLVNCNFILMCEKDEKSLRKERIRRLKQTEWQVKYAWAYWLIINHRFIGLEFVSATEQLRFFATAYNYGFRESVEDIRRWQHRKTFPYGSKYTGEQVAYADLSIEFLKKHASDIPD